MENVHIEKWTILIAASRRMGDGAALHGLPYHGTEAGAHATGKKIQEQLCDNFIVSFTVIRSA